MRKFLLELRRRRVLRTAGAYIVVAWLVVQVIDVVAPSLGLPDSAMRFAIISLIAGLPLVVVLAWFFDVSGGRVQLDEQDDPEVSRLQALSLIAISALGAALLVSLFYRPPTQEVLLPVSAAKRSVVAVMPLDWLSSIDDEDGFASGLHDDLLTTLSRIDALQVISRPSVMRLADSALSLPELAAKLGATAVLTGTVRRSAERIRINVRLTDVMSNTDLWSDAIERSFDTSGIFEIQSTIATNIARELTNALAPEESADVPQRGARTSNMTAYRAYLVGKRRVAERNSASLDQAVTKLQQAIELDPEFAAAYAELAMAYSLQVSYSNLSPDKAVKRAMPLAQRAVELAPGLAEAHTALADQRLGIGDIAGAMQSFKLAIKLNPNYARARHWYALLLMDHGSMEQTLVEHRAARELDPLSVLMTLNVAQDLLFLGRSDEALEEYENALSLDPDFVPTYAHMANLYRTARARHDKAVKWLLDAYAKDNGHTEYPSQLAAVYLEMQQGSLAEMWAQRALELGPEQYWPNRAGLLVGIYNEDEQAIRRHGELILENIPTAATPLLAMRNVFLRAGDNDAARQLFLRSHPALFGDNPVVDDGNYFAAVALAQVYREGGDKDKAQRLLKRALTFADNRPRTGHFGFDIADVEIHAMLGNTAKALDLLEGAVADNWRRNWWMLPRNRQLAALRDEPKFKALLDQLKREAAARAEAAPDAQAALAASR
jgi:TolB-like protein/Tfp pilus assembly protein PilF